jgi:hypothetical protein
VFLSIKKVKVTMTGQGISKGVKKKKKKGGG